MTLHPFARVLTAAAALALLCSCLGSSLAGATYSVVARDPQTGEMGVAVQSHWFSVGSIVSWAEAGVGAVATQSLVDVTYGPLGLELMGAGRSAEASLRALLTADDHPQIRQVAMVDAAGAVAAHTGEGCIPEAGHLVGETFSVQANLMDRDTVPAAMAAAFRATDGDLADRMIAALEAAQEEGGDIRGQQSAAILIVSGESTGRPWEDTVMDLRVEDHATPVAELKRLVRVHRGYQHMNAGDVAMEAGDVDGAEAEYSQAEEILEDNLEARFWHAVALANAGRLDRAVSLFATIFAHNDDWRRLTPRLVEPGFLTVSPQDLQRIVDAR